MPFTIDVFGLTTSSPTDMGIGQMWEDLVTTADVVLPMVYPSHYFRGYYNLKHPNSEPYMVIRRAMQDAIKRSEPLGNTAEIRPYLQAFTLGQPRYTSVHVREQIRAAQELGIDSWVLWNPRSAYEAGYFRPKTTTAHLGAQPSDSRPASPGFPRLLRDLAPARLRPPLRLLDRPPAGLILKIHLDCGTGVAFPPSGRAGTVRFLCGVMMKKWISLGLVAGLAPALHAASRHGPDPRSGRRDPRGDRQRRLDFSQGR